MWIHDQRVLHDETGTSRTVSVVLPSSLATKPVLVFCADGQAAEALFHSLHASECPNLPVLIGVHSAEATRAQEYLYDNSAEYLAREHFWVNTLRRWVEAEYGVPVTRSTSLLFGFSNGGAFALTAALRHPDFVSAVFSFSPPKLPMRPTIEHWSPLPAVYLATGNLGPEKSIRRNVANLARWLRQNHVPVLVAERQAGHTFEFWASELPHAMHWFHALPTDE